MRIGITAALLALLIASAGASPALAQERPAKQQAVYDDFEDDGFLGACAHTEATLQAVLDDIDAGTDRDTPDFRPKVEAALAERQAGQCGAEPAGGEEDLAGGGAADDPASGAAGGATGGETGTAGGPPVEEEAAAGAATGGAAGGSTPPTADDVDPLPPEITPVPAATPAPAAPATPAVAYRNEDDDLPLALLALAGLLGALALMALAYALLSRIAWVDARLAGTRRAWREAGFRAGGTWGDFTDWLRLGR